MMKPLLFFTILLSSIPCFSQYTADWLVSIHGRDTFSSPSDEARHIETDSKGDIVISGFTNGLGVFKNSNGIVDSLPLSNNNSKNVFLLKYDTLGNSIWMLSFQSNSNNVDYALSIDSIDNIYISLSYADSLVITDIVTNQPLLTYSHSIFNGGSAVIKVSPNGAVVSANTIPSWIHDIDVKNGIHVIGKFHGTVNFNLKGGNQSMTATPQRGIFICKYDYNFNLQWRRQIGGIYSHVETDDSSNVFFYGSVGANQGDFDPGIGNTWINPRNVFLGKLNSNGGFQWVRSIASSSYDQGLNIKIKNNHIYITVEYDGSLSLNGSQLPQYNSSNCLIARCNKRGQIQWVNTIHSSSGNIRNYALKVKDDRVYTAGFMTDSLILYNQNGISKSLQYSTNPFFVEYDTSGNLLSKFHFGDSTIEGSGYFDLTVPSVGQVIAVGTYSNTLNFSPLSNTPMMSASVRRYDGFVQKLSRLIVGLKKEENNFGQVIAYPNPNNGNFKVSFKKPFFGEVLIFSQTGVLKYRQRLNGETTENLNQNLSSGMYILRFVGNEVNFSQSLIVN